MDKLRSFLKSPANRFVINILLAYGSWKLLYYFLTHGPFVVTNEWANFTFSFGVFCTNITSPILRLIGEPNFTSGVHLLFDRPGGRWNMAVTEHCLAIPAMVIFSAIILAFPGQPKNKLWFIPMGLFLIFVINIMRLVFLCLIFVHYSFATYNFFHKYVYVFITYGLIFLLIMFWIKKYSFQKPQVNS
jgi:exosortase/archaeosortase family protein